MRPAAVALLVLTALAACGRRDDAPEPSVPPPPSTSLLQVPELAPGLRLILAPNLPGVAADDVPETARRRVEVVAFDGNRLKLRWTGRVRVERPDSSRRREDWVRARANASPGSTPIPEVPADYDEKDVGGTLDFPDFGKAGAFLLPGLWPEGDVTIRGAAAIWLPREAQKELVSSRRARVPFFPASPLVASPAAELLQRARSLVEARAGNDPGAQQAEVWRLVSEGEPVEMTVDGRTGTVCAIRAANWFGAYEVLADERNPLVVSVLPDPPSSTALDLFAPAGVLKTLLGYRVSSIKSQRGAAR